MAEETKTGANEESDNLGQETAGDPSAKEPPQTFTQADIDEAVNKALKEAKEQWKTDLKTQIENAKSEGERLAKMTKEEREKESSRIERENFEKAKAEFEHKSLVAEIKSQLADKKLPVSFAEMLAKDDAETSKAFLENFEKEWNAAHEKALAEKMAGKTPNIGGQNTGGGQSSGFIDIIRENQRL